MEEEERRGGHHSSAESKHLHALNTMGRGTALGVGAQVRLSTQEGALGTLTARPLASASELKSLPDGG